jgi:N-acetylglucosamine-6-phosphate deacetylase
MRFAITGARVFDGAHMLDGHTVLVEEGRIAGVVPAEAADRRTERQEVEGLLAPGFIDIQVNGGGGVLFNDQPTVEGIRAIGAAHRRYGTTGFLPTLITDRRSKWRRRWKPRGKRWRTVCPVCSGSIWKGRS